MARRRRHSGLGQFLPEDDKIQSCIAAGQTAAVSPWFKGRFLVFPQNVLGLVKADDFKVPYSGLATHVGAAGARIQAWQCDTDVKSCGIIYKRKDGSCGYTDGLATEVLSHELRRVTESIWGRRKTAIGSRARRRSRR